VRFGTDADTAFEIDGIALSGAAGLAALDDAPTGTPVVAAGTVENGRLVAETVLAGSSVPWANAEVVHGVVTARAEGVLTVSGVRYALPGGTSDPSVDFARALTVLVGDGTAVSGLGASGIESVSVGSRITASGQFTDRLTLDARDGRLRLWIVGLTGQVLDTAPLTVRVLRLEGRRPGAFDFAGTGATAADDSDPSHYEISTGDLPLEMLAAGDVVRVLGRVADFGAAPPDFVARTVVDLDLDDAAAALAVSWAPDGTTEPFLAMAPDRLDVDLSQARHLLAVRGVAIDGTGGLESIALAAPALPGSYLVGVRGSRELRLYRRFDVLVAALSDQLDEGYALNRILAFGRYNRDTQTLTTPRASFELIAP
jgi:hypothetical protein